jgi:hypothetical protein
VRRKNKQLESSHEKYFVTFAEGFTADSDSESPVIGWWAYTVPDLKEMRGRIQIKLEPDIIDGFVKSPSAALRFTFVVAAYRIITPHSSGFARLASGAFCVAIPIFTFYEIIMNCYLRKKPFYLIFVIPTKGRDCFRRSKGFSEHF